MQKQLQLSLSKEFLIQEAQKRSQLPMTSNSELTTALTVLVDSINREAQLSSLGQKLAATSLIRILTTKLLLERELKHFARSQKQKQQKHLFILGLPRTGTTLLHNLLAQNSNAHYLKLCEGQFPTPASHPNRLEEKIARSQQMTQKIYELTPSLAKVHYFHPTRPDECTWLFEYQLLDPIFYARMHVPTYYNWLLTKPNHLESYLQYRDLLVYLGQHYSFNHWVLKAPRHLVFLKALLAAFPDAGVIWLHRDPCQAIPSMCSLSYLLRSNHSDTPNPEEIGKGWSEAIYQNLNTALETRRTVGDERFYDLQYSDLIDNPIREVNKIYSHFGLNFTPEIETDVKNWLADNPQHKHGKHKYSIQQFGLNVEAIRDKFAFYTNYFGLS